ncbi:Deoxyribodipyrimidine photo-lyase-related protein [Planctomycetes bacterium Pla163]|uniref:Deoxyribodipyrimidine photo-lyase-related protein n=1 Tax=Rohdeia mirabilis TaxID=2528008 RepID=A0A518CWT9_9BACT|nr:Deoxyribodipyrimidine photo-lyase-related protein [Planctomycetes bacterium Pla163]
MPSAFHRELDARSVDPEGRSWVYVPYDQLTAAVGPLSEREPTELGIVMVESPARAARRPYHKQKLSLVLANGRQFALEQAARGVAVRHVVAPPDPKGGDFAPGLRAVAQQVGPLRVMRPAERALRIELAPLIEAGLVIEVPHAGWLTTREEFERSQKKGPPYRMDAFYREVRRRTGWLMEGDRPVGGRFSFDGENREVWRGEPPAPRQPRFRPDAVTTEVCELVEARFGAHPGAIDPAALPTRGQEAQRIWRHALEHCIESFGPYEDALSRESRTLFHTCVSSLVNLGRLLPRDLCEDVLANGEHLPSVEGFVRQVLGWREFVRHVHEATDGFRDLAPRFGGVPVEVARGAAASNGAPSNGAAVNGAAVNGRASNGAAPAPDAASTRAPLTPEGDAAPSVLDADQPLPPAYWHGGSGLACLDHEVEGVWATGYGHHITRLMVLANVATLVGASPRALTDWFWAAYTDAYDWVVEPNVLGMGTFAVGDLMTTKPYVSGAAYIHRMSDHCGACAFDPKRDCPLTPLYWTFLERNREVLAGNSRVAMPLRSLAKRSDEQRASDAAVARLARAKLAAGARLTPAGLADPESTEAQLEIAICELLLERSDGATICPSEAARRVMELRGAPGDGWRELLEPTRAAGRRLAAAGAVVFTQAGEVVDPDSVRGAVRIRRAAVGS